MASSASPSFSTCSSVRTLVFSMAFLYSAGPALNSGISSRQLRPNSAWAAASCSAASAMFMMAFPVSQKVFSASPSYLMPSASRASMVPLFPVPTPFISFCRDLIIASTSVSMNAAAFSIRCSSSGVMPYCAALVRMSSAQPVEPMALWAIFLPRLMAARAPFCRLVVTLLTPSATLSQATPFPIPFRESPSSSASFPALSAPVSTFCRSVFRVCSLVEFFSTSCCIRWYAALALETPFCSIACRALVDSWTTFFWASISFFRISTLFFM